MNLDNLYIEGDYNFVKDCDFYGLITGNAFVSSGTSLALYGMVSDNLIVEDNGKVKIHGVVRGDVINHGGEVEVDGMVIGTIRKIQV